MPIAKEHLEFHPVDLTVGWKTPAGYPGGIQEKILAGALDEKAKAGNRTRLLRFEPGARSAMPFVHDYWRRFSCYRETWWWVMRGRGLRPTVPTPTPAVLPV